MAKRKIGSETRIRITFKRGAQQWTHGYYEASIGCRDATIDNVIVHVFKDRAATGVIPSDLGLTADTLATPEGYDKGALAALSYLLRGVIDAPHWRYGRAKQVASLVFMDLAINGDKLTRHR